LYGIAQVGKPKFSEVTASKTIKTMASTFSVDQLANLGVLIKATLYKSSFRR
jgi:hypothetical protein